MIKNADFRRLTQTKLIIKIIIWEIRVNLRFLISIYCFFQER